MSSQASYSSYPSYRRSLADWIQSPDNGHLYALTQPVTWQQAHNLAIAAGGELAAVRTSEEQDWAYRTFGGAQAVWIGLSDDGTEGAWRRPDGTSGGYTNWAPGEPDNQGGAQNWAAISPRTGLPLGADGRWLDLGANFVCPALLEVDPREVGRADPFGAGCVGTNGVPRLEAVNGSVPVPGGYFTLNLQNLPLSPTFADLLRARPAANYTLVTSPRWGCRAATGLSKRSTGCSFCSRTAPVRRRGRLSCHRSPTCAACRCACRVWSSTPP